MLQAPDLSRAASGESSYAFEDEQDDEDPYGLECSTSTGAGTFAGHSRRAQVIYSSLEQLQREQEKRVEETVDCTGIAPDDAFLLLRRHGWDTQAFEETFFENPEAIRREAGVSDPDELGGKREEGLCAICFCDPGIPLMPCERRRVADARSSKPHPSYCRDCWEQYLDHAVRDGKSCLDLRCPTPGCSEAVRPSVFVDLLARRKEALDRYSRFRSMSLVDDSRGRARWCPGQGCSCSASEPPAGVREVECACGTMWCFGCGTDAHLPVSCETVQKWEEKNRDEGEDSTWIRVNTKLCPKCANPIEKNGGCMHMTCHKPVGGCGHEFCWICMGPWKNHKTCNASPESNAETEAKAMAKSELMRYGHFYERYLEHHKAQQYSAKTQKEFVSAIGEVLIKAHDFLETDVRFLSEAVREIRDCRRFLKWTYAYGFFAKFSKSKRVLFEFHQGQLEGTVDRLSDIMENTNWDAFIDKEAVSHQPFYDLRQKVMNLRDVVHQFFSNLREAIEQGTLV